MRLDIVTRGQNIYILGPFCTNLYSLPRCCSVHEQEKRWAYDERIHEVERGCFSLLVITATGGMGPSATCLLVSGAMEYYLQYFTACDVFMGSLVLILTSNTISCQILIVGHYGIFL